MMFVSCQVSSSMWPLALRVFGSVGLGFSDLLGRWVSGSLVPYIFGSWGCYVSGSLGHWVPLWDSGSLFVLFFQFLAHFMRTTCAILSICYTLAAHFHAKVGNYRANWTAHSTAVNLLVYTVITCTIIVKIE